jgi:anti-anti-sigma factor
LLKPDVRVILKNSVGQGESVEEASLRGLEVMMDIKVDQVTDVVVFRLVGDLITKADITAAFWTHLQNGFSKFVVNFSRVRTVNSTGFTALLELQHLVESSGGSIRICGLDENLRKLFKAYGLEQTFSIMRDENSAMVGLMGGVPVRCSEACVSRYLN